MVVALLDEIAERLLAIQQKSVQETPEGIVEPLAPFTVTGTPVVRQPPIANKLWFGVTIVKEEDVQLNIVVNTGKSPPTPYPMGANEKVYDLYFSRPCIYDIMLWTNGETCTVKIRGSR